MPQIPRNIICSTTDEVCTSYQEYLRSLHWGRIKHKFRSRDGYVRKCYTCASEHNLHLHHRSYKNIGAESMSDLVELCATCHHKVHFLARRGGNFMDICFAVEWLKHNLRRKKHRRIASTVPHAATESRFSQPGVVSDLIERLHTLRAEVMGIPYH